MANLIREEYRPDQRESSQKPPNDARAESSRTAVLSFLQRFREVFERSPAGVARLGLDGNWLEVNQRFCDMLGYTREELMPIKPSDLVHPQDRKGVVQERSKLISGGVQQVATQTRFIRKDGSIIWVACTTSLVRDGSGVPQYFVVVAQDVTDLKQAEEKLRRLTDLSSGALAASGIALFRWDLHSGEWEWDQSEQVIGLLPETTLRSLEGLLSLVLPEDRAELFERLTRSAKEGTPFEHEFRVTLPPEGATVWVYARGRVRRDQGGQPRSMTGAFVNMTKYRLLLRELQDSQELLLLAESAAGLHAWAVDATRDRKTWWSPNSYRLYGLKEELGVPTEEEFLKMVHPEDREQLRKISQLLGRSGSDDNFKIEFRTIPISGRVRWILSMGRVHRDAGGWPLRLVGVGIDITQRREAEEAIRRVEKLSALDRLATRIAHDINNPLMAVWNALYLITKSSQLEDAKQYAHRAQEELARITHSTNILRFRRRSTPPKQQKVGAIMRGVLNIEERKHPGVEVKQDFRDSTPLDCSRDDLEQLFDIVLRNAFDAVAGGGLVEVRVVERPNANTGELGIRVVVADTGKGMSTEVKSHLFEPFFSTKAWTGLGLGLWIASDIVAQHEGSIKIRSSQAQAHHGTVVSVFLPFRSAFSSGVISALPKAA